MGIAPASISTCRARAFDACCAWTRNGLRKLCVVSQSPVPGRSQKSLMYTTDSSQFRLRKRARQRTSLVVESLKSIPAVAWACRRPRSCISELGRYPLFPNLESGIRDTLSGAAPEVGHAGCAGAALGGAYARVAEARPSIAVGAFCRVLQLRTYRRPRHAVNRAHFALVGA
jgi:hypothetical protein